MGRNYRRLLALKGIGRETADSILVYALDKPYFVIDIRSESLVGLGILYLRLMMVRLFIEQHIPGT